MIRLKKLRASARNSPCTINAPMCNYNPETSVFAHYRSHDTGAGVGLKPDDTAGAIACSACHDWLDNRTKYPQYADDKEFYWFRGCLRTFKFWVENGILK